MALKEHRSQSSAPFIIVIFLCLLIGVFTYSFKQKISINQNRITPSPTTPIEGSKYISGSDIFNFGVRIDLPNGWSGQLKRDDSLRLYDKNIITRINVYIYPPDFSKRFGKFWDGIPIDVYQKESTIDEWLTKNLPDYKNKLVVKTQTIGNKTSYNLEPDSSKGNFMWAYRQVVLGDTYSYVIGYYNGGSAESFEKIKSEIYPRISFK